MYRPIGLIISIPLFCCELVDLVVNGVLICQMEWTEHTHTHTHAHTISELFVLFSVVMLTRVRRWDWEGRRAMSPTNNN